MRNFMAGLGGRSGVLAVLGVSMAVVGGVLWFQNGAQQTPGDKITPAAKLSKPRPAEKMSEVPDEALPQAKQAPAVQTASTEAPAFDEVRREADGMTVIAGRATPGAHVEVLQDGKALATATADRSGKFATLAIIPPTNRGHVLSLLQKSGEDEQASKDQIILAPSAGVENAAVASVPEASKPAPTSAVPANALTGQPSPAPTTPTQPAPETVELLPDASASPTSAPLPVPPAAPPLAGSSLSVDQAPQITPEPATRPASVAILRASDTGVELLNPPQPQVMDAVTLDTISYSDIGDVQLAGRAQADTETVRVYLDNDAVVSLPVDDQGRWRGDLPEVDAGLYTLRVDEVAADGSVSSRVETPFKRESVATLHAASTDQDGPIKTITVQKGATLWAIARDRYGDGLLYVRVFEANTKSIRNPDLIYPGQVFDLPD